MSIIVQRASDVRIQEINMSQVVTSNSTSVACMVFASKKGRTVPYEIFSGDDFLAEYGNPDPSVSMAHYCGLDFFREGNDGWFLRVAGESSLTDAIVLYYDATAQVVKMADVGGIADPTAPDWINILPGGGGDGGTNGEAIGIFYPKQGPGSYADVDQEGYAISITTAHVSTPTNVSVASSATGGSLSSGTYEYQVSSVGQYGETLASETVTVVISGSTSTYSNVIAWTADPKAWGYYIYGRTNGATYGVLTQVGAGVTTFTDTGELLPNVSQQPLTADQVPVANTSFIVNIYLLSQSTTNPVESFPVTLTDNVDSDGSQTEIEERISGFSQYFNFLSNVPALSTPLPVVGDIARVGMTGGSSGSAVTSSQLMLGWDKFLNKQLYSINTLINGGFTDPALQQEMIYVAETRGDVVAMLDTPSLSQSVQNALNYRRLTLNANTTYAGLFCPDVLEADKFNGRNQYVPFSGNAAALCARTDRVANPSFSIAGLNRGLLTHVMQSRYSYDDGEATKLFQSQVNYTRKFIGQGIALWEQQTLSTPMSALSWISVRRIVNVIKTSLYQFGLYFLQEPNDDFTARGIVSTFSQYLQAVQDARGLSSFNVTSSALNNSSVMTGAGIRRVTVILVPMIPIHELQIQAVITQQGVDFTEILRAVSNQ